MRQQKPLADMRTEDDCRAGRRPGPHIGLQAQQVLHSLSHHGTKPPLHVHLHVIVALMLRELHTINGESKIGYLWTIVRTAFAIMILWGLRMFMRFSPPHGMTVLCFLALGFLIWNIFSRNLTSCLKAVEGNRALLTYPHVYPLDIMLARSLVITATHVVSTAIILIIGVFLGFPITLTHLDLLLMSLGMAMTLGLGAGMFLSALAIWLPFLHHIIPMVLRIMFFVSGVFFSVSMFTRRIGDWLLLNPVMQIIELARTAMAKGYMSPYYDIYYLLGVNLALFSLGLLLERFVRRRLQA